MNKMVVVVFKNETDAFKGLDGLKELHEEGTITLFSSAIAVKDHLDIVSMKNMEGQGASKTFAGMALGSLIGLLGGPAGLAAGAFAGSMTGLLFDMNNAGVNGEFIDDVSDAMKPNSVTLLAEIDEEKIIPLDTKMEACHGLIFRRLLKETENDQLIREISLNVDEMEHLKTELNDDEDTQTHTKIKDNILKIKQKLKILEKRTHTKLEDAKIEYNGKESILRDQFKAANDHKKEKIEKKQERLEEEYKTHFEKLNEAYQSVKSALSSHK